MTKNHRTLKLVRNVLLILLGNAVYALAVVSFLLPSGIITGGTTGLGDVYKRQSSFRSPAVFVPFPYLITPERISQSCCANFDRTPFVPYNERGVMPAMPHFLKNPDRREVLTYDKRRTETFF